MENFNLALLTKQGWRILHNPVSLVSCILKQKYFPKGEFLEAKMVGRPFQVWQSLLAGRTLLKAGLIWRIGNGQSIKIWEAQCINRAYSFKVQSPISILDNQDNVFALLLLIVA